MATIAKGSITLVNVNDAYSVTVTPTACTIKADFDGSNPTLADAHCDIYVVRGGTKVPFTIGSQSVSNNEIEYQLSHNAAGTIRRLQLTQIPDDELSGSIELDIIAGDNEFVCKVIFQYSVVREAAMLDWIQDWNNNRTTINGESIITPKIFIGQRDAEDKITGVYIGPATQGEDFASHAGIYAIKGNHEIFHLDEEGGSIGGWKIEFDSIRSLNDRLRLYADGSIAGFDEHGDESWFIVPGGAIFADGAAQFTSDGVYVAGEIHAYSGEIGGWNIDNYYISTAEGAFELNGYNKAISIYANSHPLYSDLERVGGVRMYYNTNLDYGIVAYAPMTTNATHDPVRHCTFKLGSINRIASWEFDDGAIFKGTQWDTQRTFTRNVGDITIGSTGIRGFGWYLDNDGEVAFGGGDLSFFYTPNGMEGNLVGWRINKNRIATDNVAIVSSQNVAGLYLSGGGLSSDSQFKTKDAGQLAQYITQNGGIFLAVNSLNNSEVGAVLKAYNQEGHKVFQITDKNDCYIGPWTFNQTAIYNGELITLDGFATPNSLILSTTGIRGCKWRFEANGAGAIAGGNISWDSNGVVSFAPSVSLNWTQGIEQAKDYATLCSQASNGKVLFRDPEFTGDDFNGTGDYPFGMTTMSRAIVTDNEAPNSSHRVMEITSTTWASTTDYRLGGFRFANASRPNAKYAVKIVAKIPVGWRIQNHHNDYGDGGKTEWLTSRNGTGQYTEYICVVTCGATGNFSTINHFALGLIDGNDAIYTPFMSDLDATIEFDDGTILSSVSWRIAYATVLEVTAADKTLTTIDIDGIYTGSIRADQIKAGTIDATKISASGLTAGAIISNGDAWALKKNGSGFLANGNITWDADGNGSLADGHIIWNANGLSIDGSITANDGQIGNFHIDHYGLYAGTPSKWTDAIDYTQTIDSNTLPDLSQIVPGTIMLRNTSSYSGHIIDDMRVAIGNHIDPEHPNDGRCNSVGYFYRSMINSTSSEANNYIPAVKIISENRGCQDIALRTKGAIVANGSVLSNGRFVHLIDSSQSLNPATGSVFVVRNATNSDVSLYLPTTRIMHHILGHNDDFAVIIKVIISYDSSNAIKLRFNNLVNQNNVPYESQDVTIAKFRDNDGGEVDEISMEKGDIVELALICTTRTIGGQESSVYYAQIINHHD